MDKKVAIIGSGNVFFKDEGIGLYTAKYLKENYKFSPNVVDIIDGGTLGFKLMPLLQEYDEVIIINTSSDEKRYGSISIKTTQEFLDGGLIKKTANEVEIAEMLQVCSLSSKMANVYVVSITPEDIISVEVGLCESMYNAFFDFLQTIEDLLNQLEITVEKQQNISLQEIITIFANPSIEYNRGF